MSARGTPDLVARRLLALVWPTGRMPTEPDAIAAAPSELTRWSDYFAVAATARFRATQRARLRDAARTGMLFVVVASLFDCVWLIPFHPDAFLFLVGLNGSVGLVAALGYVWLGSRARRHPEVVAYIVLATVDVATVALGVYHPALSLVAAGYVLLLPAIVALGSRGQPGTTSDGLSSTPRSRWRIRPLRQTRPSPAGASRRSRSC